MTSRHGKHLTTNCHKHFGPAAHFWTKWQSSPWESGDQNPLWHKIVLRAKRKPPIHYLHLNLESEDVRLLNLREYILHKTCSLRIPEKLFQVTKISLIPYIIKGLGNTESSKDLIVWVQWNFSQKRFFSNNFGKFCSHLRK